jgi:hypothetical protein
MTAWVPFQAAKLKEGDHAVSHEYRGAVAVAVCQRRLEVDLLATRGF